MTPSVAPTENRYQLAPVAPVALPATLDAPPQALQRRGLFTTDTLVHGAMSVASVGGLGTVLYLGASGSALVTAALAAAVATGVAAARFLGVGGSAQRRLLAAVDDERRALGETRNVLATQASFLGADRDRLGQDYARLDADRAQLAAQRHDLAQTVAAEVQRTMAPQEQALAEARAVFERDRAAFDARLEGARKELSAEAAALTDEDLANISAAVLTYHTGAQANLLVRIVGEVYNGGYGSTVAQRMVEPSQVVATLVNTGKVVAGKVVQASDNFYVVPAEGAVTITSIAQLREFLRLATGKTV